MREMRDIKRSLEDVRGLLIQGLKSDSSKSADGTVPGKKGPGGSGSNGTDGSTTLPLSDGNASSAAGTTDGLVGAVAKSKSGSSHGVAAAGSERQPDGAADDDEVSAGVMSDGEDPFAAANKKLGTEVGESLDARNEEMA